MAFVVKCLLCEKDLNFDRADPTLLWEHISNEHPLFNSKSRNSEESQESIEILKNNSGGNSKDLNNFLEKSVQTDSIDWSDYFKKKGMGDFDSKKPPDQARSPRESEEFHDIPLSRDSRDSRNSKNPESSIKSDETNKATTSQEAHRKSKESNEVPISKNPLNRDGSRFNKLLESLEKKSPERGNKQKPEDQAAGTSSKKHSDQHISLKCPLKRIAHSKDPGKTQLLKDHSSLTSSSGQSARTSRDFFIEKKIASRETGRSKLLYQRKYKPVKPIVQDTSKLNPEEKQEILQLANKKVKYYKTSIEKWRPGGAKIICANCGAKGRPVVKSRTSRQTSSALGASLILTCWPFCLAPCLFSAPKEECLHCATCNFYLGTYDHQRAVIKPNMDVFK
jgi:hypothetical protein